jgi:hypothetical protein
MKAAREQIFFTIFLGLALAGALLVAKEWPIRASIIILLLGSVGLILVLVQIARDVQSLRTAEVAITRPTFEVQAIEHQGRWGTLEIWAWLCHLIGFPVALPLFVFLYVKAYGGSWKTSVLLAALTSGFLYAVYENLLNVPWPKPWIAHLFAG